MNLLKTYIKLLFIKNKLNYLLVTLSIIAAYIAITVVMIYFDNVLILSPDYGYPDFRYIYLSIRSVFLIAGIAFVISQFYYSMKAGLKDYCILKTLGATKGNIRVLILLQVLFLNCIILPVGLSGGFVLAKLLIEGIGRFSIISETGEILNSIRTFKATAFTGSCIIIFIGIYLDFGIRKIPITNILSDHPVINHDV